VAAVETFTFPDGHISFTHPGGWTVKTKPRPALNAEAQKTSFYATVFDSSGAEMAHVLSDHHPGAKPVRACYGTGAGEPGIGRDRRQLKTPPESGRGIWPDLHCNGSARVAVETEQI
jgi:hypothetical protein